MATQRDKTTAGGVCAVCGRRMPPNAPGGLCPACLLGRGVALATRARARPGDFVPPAPEELSVLFPEFEIVSLLGRGGMGAVYKAVQPELDRTVAVKLLPPETAQDAEFMERFRREAATLARLDHPGIGR
jgi:serine/threonine-protein kinase